MSLRPASDTKHAEGECSVFTDVVAEANEFETNNGLLGPLLRLPCKGQCRQR